MKDTHSVIMCSLVFRSIGTVTEDFGAVFDLTTVRTFALNGRINMLMLSFCRSHCTMLTCVTALMNFQIFQSRE